MEGLFFSKRSGNLMINIQKDFHSVQNDNDKVIFLSHVGGQWRIKVPSNTDVVEGFRSDDRFQICSDLDNG